MRRIAAIAALTVALGALSGCADLDGYSDYGGGRGHGGSYGYRPTPQPYWGGGYAPQRNYGYRGDDGGRFRGGDQGRGGDHNRGAAPSRDPRPAFFGQQPSGRPAAAQGPVGRVGPQGGRSERRVEQGAD